MAHKTFATSILKGLVLTVGGGVALGVGIRIGQGQAQEAGGSGPDSGADLEPVLDRLHGIESRVGRMESVLTEHPVASPAASEATTSGEPIHRALGDFESRLSSQGSAVDSLRHDLRAIDERSSERLTQFGETVDQLHTRLPVLIEEKVGACFHQMEEKLHREIEETHARTLDTFVDNIQTKVVQRISTFESDLAGQAEAMNQLRDYSLKTDQNMQRLLAGVDRLASEISRRTDSPAATSSIAAPAEPPPTVGSWPGGAGEGPRSGTGLAEVPPEPAAKPAPSESAPAIPSEPPPGFIPNTFLEQDPEAKSGSKWRRPLMFGVPVVLIGSVVGWQLSQNHSAGSAGQPVEQTATHTDPKAAQDASPPAGATTNLNSAPPSAAADEASRIESAREFARRKDYAKAEEVYRAILKTDPQNREVVLALADVLYRQQKFEQSAAVLKALSSRAKTQ